jgi:hypothetical protein
MEENQEIQSEVVSQSELIPAIEREEWYLNLVDELKTIIVEGEFNARFALVETYHQFGKKILEENDNFERSKIYGDSLVRKIAQSIEKSERTVYNAIAFAKKFPELSDLPEGKNTSWSKICKQLLPSRVEDTKPAPIVIDDKVMLRQIIESYMDNIVEYAEPTDKGYKMFLPRELLVAFYSKAALPLPVQTFE